MNLKVEALKNRDSIRLKTQDGGLHSWGLYRLIYPGEWVNPWDLKQTTKIYHDKEVPAHTVSSQNVSRYTLLGCHAFSDMLLTHTIIVESFLANSADPTMYVGYGQHLNKPEIDELFSWLITQPLEDPKWQKSCPTGSESTAK